MNRFKTALAEGRTQIGLWQALASPYTAEICAGAGFDWLLIDGEHGPNDLPLLLRQLQAVAAYPIEAVARVPAGDPVLIKQYLDVGARSLLVPMVESGDQAARLVQATRYPPRGTRGVGVGVVRASRWNRTANYMLTAEADICLLLQVETEQGVENLDAIAGTDGVDGVFIGPADLSAAMGFPGQPTHAEVQRVVERSIGRIRGRGKAAGILMPDEALTRRCIALGATFVAVGTDVGVLARGAEALARRFGSPGPAAEGSGAC